MRDYGLFSFWHLLRGATLALWLFYSPLSAQQIYKKEQIGWEFGIGVKTTLPVTSLLKEITNSNISRGVFAESRLGNSGAWLRIRAAMDDWGQNVYSEDHRYTTEVWRLRGTVGLMRYFSGYSAADLYWCLDVGVNHWDINSTHPLFGREKYNRVAAGLSLGVQARHIFLEIATEFHSMDNKGIKREGWTDGGGDDLFPSQLIKVDHPAGVSISLLAGWKF